MSALRITSVRGVQGQFYLQYDAQLTAQWPSEISLEADSDRVGEDYPALDAVPMMKETKGSRQVEPLTALPKFVRNVHFDTAIDIPEEWFRRDMTGQIQVRINDLVNAATSHWAHLTAPLIINGTTGQATDGKFYFATDHERGISGVQSNLLTISLATIPVTGNTTGSTPANPAVNHMQYAIAKAIAQLRGFVNDKKEPINESATEFLWFGPTSLGHQAASAVALPRGTDANEIPLMPGHSVRVVDTARANAWTDRFVIFRRGAMSKAMILQQETAPRLLTKGPGSEYAIDNFAYFFGIDTWRQADYGMWEHACQVILTA